MSHGAHAIHALISSPLLWVPVDPVYFSFVPCIVQNPSTQREREMAFTSAMLGAIRLIPSPSTNLSSNSNSSSLPSVRAQKCTHITPKSAPNKLQSVVSLPLSAAIPSIAFLLSPEAALAANGEFGILEGRTLALIHPVVMGGLFVYTLWAGYLGWQWRRVRTIQDEINELKKQVKAPAVEAAPVTAGGGSETAAPPPPPSPEVSAVEAKIQQLTEERKALLKGSYRDRHFNAGSLLLGFGVLESVGGGLNTWFRTGKLFPGPHLFAGAAITVLWALAAALVPAMQKGNETARNLHIALNTLNVVLFIWQIPTGFEIVLKVFEFTKWP
ncbi:Stromelysin-1 [Rhynchospora pubera]|uniref:Stromelysin-1 n=1 Tax=Rhynchospora pubera TaxID=906938 RepID=A0AAV8DVR8_9POAL|nr:Stromelysin-1 [Rhynchospora pubera]